jgi:hypothetical protein
MGRKIKHKLLQCQNVHCWPNRIKKTKKKEEEEEGDA